MSSIQNNIDVVLACKWKWLRHKCRITFRSIVYLSLSHMGFVPLWPTPLKVLESLLFVVLIQTAVDSAVNAVICRPAALVTRFSRIVGKFAGKNVTNYEFNSWKSRLASITLKIWDLPLVLVGNNITSYIENDHESRTARGHRQH